MAAALIIHSSIAILVAIFLSGFVTKSEGGELISVDLFHRDSPVSPFYNPHETPYQRIEKALKRSSNRLNRLFNASSLSAHSGLIVDPDDGGYLMNISIGTPPFQILGVADTGSDIVWTQCRAYPNKDNLFTTASSSTYKTVPCPSRDCYYLGPAGAFCSPVNDKICHYKSEYGDGSHSLGDFAHETLTLESLSTPVSTVSFRDIIIGCSYDTYYPNPGEKFDGVIGLGRGPTSLINQLGPYIDWRFSYCLPLFGGAKPLSRLDLGGNVTGDGVVSTPLINGPSDSLYFLKLGGMTVGDVGIPFNDDVDIFIDSGTTMSMLPTGYFVQLLTAVERQIVGKKRVADPQSFFELCYEMDIASPITNAPSIIMHFLNADVELPQSNLFFQVSDTVACFAFSPSHGGSIYGNVAQQNFLIGYDLQKKTVSFKPADCGWA
ncbi:Aspartic proteinase CDR1 [Linum grandiflorum]